MYQRNHAGSWTPFSVDRLDITECGFRFPHRVLRLKNRDWPLEVTHLVHAVTPETLVVHGRHGFGHDNIGLEAR